MTVLLHTYAVTYKSLINVLYFSMSITVCIPLCSSAGYSFNSGASTSVSAVASYTCSISMRLQIGHCSSYVIHSWAHIQITESCWVESEMPLYSKQIFRVICRRAISQAISRADISDPMTRFETNCFSFFSLFNQGITIWLSVHM